MDPLLLLQLLLLLLAPVVATASTKCLPEKNQYYHPDHRKCISCPGCRSGTETDKQEKVKYGVHGALSCRSCVICAPGKFKSAASDTECHTCYDCELQHRHEIRACSAQYDVVCGDCLPGFFEFHEPKGSMPCKNCRFDENEHENCTNYHTEIQEKRLLKVNSTTDIPDTSSSPPSPISPEKTGNKWILIPVLCLVLATFLSIATIVLLKKTCLKKFPDFLKNLRQKKYHGYHSRPVPVGEPTDEEETRQKELYVE